MEKLQFIIVAHARSGSTLLCNSLNQHPDIKVYVEALHPCDPGVVAWRKHYIQKINIKYLDAVMDGVYSRLKERDDFDLLVNEIYKDYNGFKILLQQLPLNYKIWEHFVANKKLKIIYLHRENLLESAMSIKLAERTKVWQIGPTDMSVKDKPIFISEAFLEKYFKHTLNNLSDLKVKFENHYNLTINYNDLCNNWDETISLVEDFLCIKKFKLPMSTGKRTSQCPCDLIVNYNALKDYFADTEWKMFF